ncbi:MAG: hypothetical protein WCC66_02205 [Rhizobiaceae bacterium]
MNTIDATIKPVLLISGLITSTMLFAAIAPDAALQSMFGETVAGPLAALVVRNWAILVTLVGLALAYAAFRPAARNLVLVMATLSKLAFISLVLAYGFSKTAAGVSIAVDAAFVCVFLIYLVANFKRNSPKRYS